MKILKKVVHPKRIFLGLILIIFIVELLVHSMVLPWIGGTTSVVGAFLNALLVILVLYPVVFFLSYKPLVSQLTERQAIEEEYRTIFENSPNAILAVIDETGKIVRVNAQTEKSFGYFSNELMGKEVECLIPVRLREMHKKYRNEYMSAPTARPMGVGRDLRGLRKDGSEFPVEVALTPVKIGGQTLILTTITDITIRKSLEMQRDQAIEGGRIGMWDWNLETGQMMWSPRCKELFSLEADANPNYKSFLSLILPEDRERVENAIKEALENKIPYGVEMRVRHKDMTIRWILSKGRGYYDSQGKAIRMSGVVLDISDLKRAVHLRDEVIAIVSHDIKNPLTTIDLQAYILEKAHSADDALVKITRNIRRTISQLNKLLNDLLDTSRLESGKIELHPCEEALKSIAEEVLATNIPLLNEKQIKVKLGPVCSKEKVFCDRDRMLQVFSNVLSNSVKFTPQGGSISITCKSAEGLLTVTIADSGQGIAPDELPHVFDRFWQAQRTKRAGTGLGLAIVKGIIEAHGGKIWIESQLGKGTSVHFTIPKALRKVA